MKTISALFILSILLSCSKNKVENVCNVKNPLVELEWLSDYVNDNYIIYKVIVLNVRDKKRFEGFFWLYSYRPMQYNSYDLGPVIYNCEGQVICQMGSTHRYRKCQNRYKIIKSEIIHDGSK